jgi:predicted dithiol-disulfide oxidoreductase (DUF899 family)
LARLDLAALGEGAALVKERASQAGGPLAKLERWKAKRGWQIPWYSSGESDFNYDFGVTIDASRGFDEFNFRSRRERPLTV